MDWTQALLSHIALMIIIDPDHFNQAMTQIMYAVSRLRGTAADWAAGQMPGMVPPWPTVPDFVTGLRNAFLGESAVDKARQEIYHLQQASFPSLAEYIKAFRRLLRQIPNMGDVDARDLFIKQLNNAFYAEVIRARPQTLEAAIAAAHAADVTFRRLQGHADAPPAATSSTAGYGHNNDQAAPMELGAIAAQLSAMIGRDKCWLCYKPGHYHGDCPNLSQVHCRLCFAAGHEAHKCRAFVCSL
jgi:hypothetical protein